MILNDKAIIKNQAMIEGFNPDNINPISYDVTLYHVIKRERPPWYVRLLDFLQTGKRIPIVKSPNRFEVIDISGYSKEKPFWFRRGDFVLAATQEIFHLPETVASDFVLKSSTGRIGYGHQLAGLGDPGWHDSRLTLELFVPCRAPLPLYPGLKIGQMVFEEVEAPLVSYRQKGHYNGDLVAQESRMDILGGK